MDIKDLQNKKVVVLGFGQEGQAVTQYLLKHGISPAVLDEKPLSKCPQIDLKTIKSLRLDHVLGPGSFKQLKKFDIAFRSPGIPLSHTDFKQRTKDQRSKIIFSSQTKWFFEHCPAKIIGVTGTKGKGTTASLIYEILKKNFQIKSKNQNPKTKVYLTGNIGKDQPLDFLDKLKPNDWVVYELSSFQLQDLDRSPHIGVVLMVTSEHLDYHRDVHEYAEAKEAICKFQTPADFTIVNANYESSIGIGHLGKGQKLDFSTLEPISTYKPGDCYVNKGQLNLKSKPYINIAELQLRGSHNWQNVCASILAARAAGASDNSITQSVKNFKGLEHRLQFVAEKKGIKYYNDSFSTTPETAIAAINAFKEPEILILGGSAKKSDFRELGKTILSIKNIKGIILVGQEALRIKKTISGFKGKILEGAKSMEEIFAQVKEVATKGDVVLLSPACASFDMFKNYRDRGEQFKKFVIKNG